MLNTLWQAFLVGGLICTIAQLVIELTPFQITPAHVLVSYVVSGAVLSAIGLYQPLVDFAGAGATVPLSGFGHLLAHGWAHRCFYRRIILRSFRYHRSVNFRLYHRHIV